MAGNISVRLETIDNILSDEQYTITEGTLCLVRGTLACLGVAANIVNVKNIYGHGAQGCYDHLLLVPIVVGPGLSPDRHLQGSLLRFHDCRIVVAVLCLVSS